jgi:hypothetical protein
MGLPKSGTVYIKTTGSEIETVGISGLIYDIKIQNQYIRLTDLDDNE